MLGDTIDSPYLKPVDGNLLVRTRALFRDPVRWRDTWWLIVNVAHCQRG